MNLSYILCSARAINLTCTFILVTLLVIFQQQDSVHGAFSERKTIDSALLTKRIGTNRVITVDANGEGDFKSVQAAVDHVPDGNSNWIVIHLTKGVYRIPANKPYIFMRGSGRGRTSIASSHISTKDYDSATLKVEAPHFVALNTAPTGINRYSAENKSSVAAFVGADKVAFYQCAFFSNQNTLFDYKGRHLSASYLVGDRRVEIGGSIAAHYRERHDESSGFVFVKGKVYGIGRDVYLGRAKGAHSRVVFANTYLSRSIIHHGWTNWRYSGNTDNLYHAEYKCHGPGSASKNRAHWSKQLSDEEAAPFLSIDFIRGKEWLLAWLL
ncbi:UNVERIFIED_CONTAM: putative pectinesterase 67 [Sesamum latifolium]|uniref:pectinesterase n=1 Tax=Sesamum latifolium TaxID=2727402 RepID=A0AAW2XTN2_9LAMI